MHTFDFILIDVCVCICERVIRTVINHHELRVYLLQARARLALYLCPRTLHLCTIDRPAGRLLVCEAHK